MSVDYTNENARHDLLVAKDRDSYLGRRDHDCWDKECSVRSLVIWLAQRQLDADERNEKLLAKLRKALPDMYKPKKGGD